MKKKVINYILMGFLALGFITYFACLIWYKEPTIAFTEKVKDFINQPLPIAGVSILAIGGVAWGVISRTSYGKKQIALINEKANESKEKYEQCKTLLEETKQVLNEQIDTLKSENTQLKEFIVELGNTIPNKKVKELVQKQLEKLEGVSYEKKED